MAHMPSCLTPGFADATVADVMHRGVLTCTPDATVAEVAGIMATNRVHCVVVSGLAADATEQLAWGIVSDADLLAASASASELTAGEVAASHMITVAPATPLSDAARLMVEHDTTHLVVTRSRRGAPLGVVSSLDVAAAIAATG